MAAGRPTWEAVRVNGLQQQKEVGPVLGILFKVLHITHSAGPHMKPYVTRLLTVVQKHDLAIDKFSTVLATAKVKENNVNLCSTSPWRISKALRYGPCVTTEAHSFSCHPHMNHACLCLWCSLHLSRKGWLGWVDLGGWLHTKINVTHPSTNRAQRRSTLLITLSSDKYFRWHLCLHYLLFQKTIYALTPTQNNKTDMHII